MPGGACREKLGDISIFLALERDIGLSLMYDTGGAYNFIGSRRLMNH